MIRLLALVGTVLILAAASPSPGATLAPEPGAAARPLVFAYYYIWYTPTSWNRAKTDLPTLGAYDSADRAVIAQHMAWAKQAGIDALIVSWKHQPRLDGPLQTVVEEAANAGLKLVLLYQGLDFNRQAISDATVASDINWFMDTYGTSPVFNVFGRPAVVWSGTWGYTDKQIAGVRAQIGAPDRILLLGSERSGASYAARAGLFDGDAYYWSSPDPLKTPGYQSRLQTIANAVRVDSGIWIAPAAPGFDARLVGGTSTVSRRDGATFRAAWAGAVRTKPDAIGIISWNEFSENSQIEPSETYASEYLRITAALTGQPTASASAAPSIEGAVDPGVDSSSELTPRLVDGPLSNVWAIVLIVAFAVIVRLLRRRPA